MLIPISIAIIPIRIANAAQNQTRNIVRIDVDVLIFYQFISSCFVDMARSPFTHDSLIRLAVRLVISTYQAFRFQF